MLVQPSFGDSISDDLEVSGGEELVDKGNVCQAVRLDLGYYRFVPEWLKAELMFLFSRDILGSLLLSLMTWLMMVEIVLMAVLCFRLPYYRWWNPAWALHSLLAIIFSSNLPCSLPRTIRNYLFMKRWSFFGLEIITIFFASQSGFSWLGVSVMNSMSLMVTWHRSVSLSIFMSQ